MKKGHGIKRALPVVARPELEPLPTGALLARLRRLRWCEDGPECSDLLPQEIASVDGQILFKCDPRWQTAYSDVKEVLATRDHVERKIG